MKVRVVATAVLLSCCIFFCYAERLIPLPSHSKQFQLFLLVENIENKIVVGKNSLQIKDAKSNKLLQTIDVNNKNFNTDSLYATIKSNRPIYVEDINFDGHADIFIKAAAPIADVPIYQVFTYIPTTKQFAMHQGISNLTMVGDGVLLPSNNKKTIFTKAIWGCCGIEYNEYQVTNTVLTRIAILQEDNSNGEYVVVTTQKLLNKEWETTTKIYKASLYYKKF